MKQQSSSTKVFVTPSNADLLAGRGSTIFKHPGNKNLRSVVVNMLDLYNSYQKKTDKSCVIEGVMQSIQRQGGRFLKFDKAAKQWYQADEKEFRLKVSATFRDANIPNKVKCMEVMKSKSSKVISPVASSTSLVSVMMPALIEEDDTCDNSMSLEPPPITSCSLSPLLHSEQRPYLQRSRKVSCSDSELGDCETHPFANDFIQQLSCTTSSSLPHDIGVDSITSDKHTTSNKDLNSEDFTSLLLDDRDFSAEEWKLFFGA